MKTSSNMYCFWVCLFLMVSNFYIVHHEFRAGTSSKWWKTAYAAMAPGGGWDEAGSSANKEIGFYKHSANAVTSDGPIYCIWKTKKNIKEEEFQELLIARQVLDLV